MRDAIEYIRAEQLAGTMGIGYIFAGYGQRWLAGGVYYSHAVPLWTEWYIAVIPDKEPLFIYGADSCQHIQADLYREWIKTLIDSGGLNW